MPASVVATPGESFDWGRVFELWGFVEADFNTEYGVNLEDALARSWRWFRVRLFGLLAKGGTRLAVAWNPPKPVFEGEDPETEFS